jgi:hypothetical protein
LSFTKITNSRAKSLVFLFVILAIFLKVDFRLQTDIICCSDDHDYYIHAETTVIDFDFDYANQLKGFENKRNNLNSKPSPIGFYGTGLLSAPFLYLGSTIDKFTTHNIELGYSNKVLFYSFSSPFYFLLTFFFLTKIKKELGINYSNIKLLLLFLGTGLPYYALERFSMTHVYDTFSITCLIYVLILYYKSGSTKFIFFTSFFIFLTLLIRWTNYQVFLLPFIINKLFFANSNYKIRNQFQKFFLANSFFTLLFLFHTKLIWGVYTLNPRKIYNQHDFVSVYFQNLIDSPFIFLIDNIKYLFITLFTEEFGVFWFSPIIFFGLIFSFLLIKKDSILAFTLLIIYSFYFAIINVWQSTGNAYGFRYLYPLITISMLLFLNYYKLSDNPKRLVEYYLLFFSVLSLLSVLFFEGWEGTQLSLNVIENSFGKYEKFVQPAYLTGFIKGFLEITTYLKIFTTSFLGLIIFKILIVFFSIEKLLYFLEYINLPVDNSNFISYISQVSALKSLTIVFISLTLLAFAYLMRQSLETC